MGALFGVGVCEMKRSDFLEKWSPLIPDLRIAWAWVPQENAPMIGVLCVMQGDKALFMSRHIGGPFEEPSALLGADQYLTDQEQLLSL